MCTIMVSTRDTPTSDSKQSLAHVAGESSTKKSPELAKVMVDMKDFRQMFAMPEAFAAPTR